MGNREDVSVVHLESHGGDKGSEFKVAGVLASEDVITLGRRKDFSLPSVSLRLVG
jgi:hypothetical protein